MKIRAMENIPTGFTYPVPNEKGEIVNTVYKGAPLKCGDIADVDEKDAAPLIAAGVAEATEKKAMPETSGKKG